MQDWFLYKLHIKIKSTLIAHKIFQDENMDCKNDSIWRYFTEEERYTLKCKICDILHLFRLDIYQLKGHLKINT